MVKTEHENRLRSLPVLSTLENRSPNQVLVLPKDTNESRTAMTPLAVLEPETLKNIKQLIKKYCSFMVSLYNVQKDVKIIFLNSSKWPTLLSSFALRTTSCMKKFQHLFVLHSTFKVIYSSWDTLQLFTWKSLSCEIVWVK